MLPPRPNLARHPSLSRIRSILLAFQHVVRHVLTLVLSPGHVGAVTAWRDDGEAREHVLRDPNSSKYATLEIA